MTSPDFALSGPLDKSVKNESLRHKDGCSYSNQGNSTHSLTHASNSYKYKIIYCSRDISFCCCLLQESVTI